MSTQAPRTSCTDGTYTEHLPPLRFHSVHSKTVRISRDGSEARRMKYYFGVAFSARPVRINEKIRIRFVEISNIWGGFIYFGFTGDDPSTHRHGDIPENEYNPSTENVNPRIWAKKLGNGFCKKDDILYYYVNSAGDIHFGVNGEDRGLFFTGVDTRNPRWAVVNLHGDCTVIEFTSHTSWTGDTPNKIHPLTLNIVSGENVKISRDGSKARRRYPFTRGLAFSARPVLVNEKVRIRLLEISHSYYAGFCFGFTNHDPGTLHLSVPNKDGLYLNGLPGYWARMLGDRFYKKDDILYYYVNPAGVVHFGVNGENKGRFFSGVDTTSPLWALVDLYGKCAAIQFTNPTVPNQIRRSSNVDDDRLVGSMGSLSVEEPLPALRCQSPLVPLTLHWTKGRNVHFVNDIGVAARVDAGLCQGYVFTARPISPRQTILVQILATVTDYAGSLSIGYTSCDPATLRPCDLPDDTEELLDRPEYWVVQRDAANDLWRGDELAVTLTRDGEVRVCRNGTNQVTVMHVDHMVKLWAFVEIYGATQRMRIFSSQPAQTPPQQLSVLAGSATGSGGTVPVVGLPPQTLASAHFSEQIRSSQLDLENLRQIPAPDTCAPCRPARTECTTSQNNVNEQVQIPERPTPSTSRNMPSSSHHQNLCCAIGEGATGTRTECTICYEKPIDSTLYKCGHMCMCYGCAVEQWTGMGDGQCPLCRAAIVDVIRTYKS